MRRERLTITLDSELLQAVDTSIDKQTIRNRSHAIENLLRKGLGLWNLKKAFIFFQAGWEMKTFDNFLDLCLQEKIDYFFLGFPGQSIIEGKEIQEYVRHFFTRTESVLAGCELVPLDFGSGGALILHQDKLSESFLTLWPRVGTLIPESLVAAINFHQQHQGILTELIQTSPSHQEAAEYRFTGLAIASPEILKYIPAGKVSLEQDTFPLLRKSGKVKGYFLA
jgi:hypothetical protein